LVSHFRSIIITKMSHDIHHTINQTFHAINSPQRHHLRPAQLSEEQ
jgi:hypothetical protein